MTEIPSVEVTPGYSWGQPRIGNIPVCAVAGYVWAGEGVDVVAAEYTLTRQQILVACWYAGTYGLPAEPVWRRRWGAWAEAVYMNLIRDEDVADPPTRDDL